MIELKRKKMLINFLHYSPPPFLYTMFLLMNFQISSSKKIVDLLHSYFYISSFTYSYEPNFFFQLFFQSAKKVEIIVFRTGLCGGWFNISKPRSYGQRVIWMAIWCQALSWSKIMPVETTVPLGLDFWLQFL